MGLKAVIEDINAIDEAQRSFYVEKEGVYVLDVDPVQEVGGRKVHYALEDTLGLRTALQSERGNARKLAEKVAVWGEHDPAKVKAELEELNALRASSGDLEGKARALAESQVKQVVAKHQTELENTNKQATRYKNLVHKLKVNDAIAAAIRKAGGDDSTVLLLMPHMAPNVALREVGDDILAEVVDPTTNQPRIGDATGAAMSLDQLAAEMKASSTFASAFPGTGRSGSGTQSTTRRAGGAPRKKSEFNSRQRSDYIEANGAEAWINLPD